MKHCSHHPGVYRNTGTTISASIYVGWSCCKAIDEKEGGCHRRESHVEDMSMGGCMRMFKGAGDPAVAADMERRIREAEEREAEEEEAKRRRGAVLVDDDDDEEDDDEEEGVGEAGIRGEGDAQVAGSTLALKDTNLDADGNILHSVRPTDTLQGLSLRYGVGFPFKLFISPARRPTQSLGSIRLCLLCDVDPKKAPSPQPGTV
jgi:hypothetical protein